MKTDVKKILTAYRICRGALSRVILKSDDSDNQVTEKLDISREFIKSVIDSELPPAMKKHLFKIWTKKAFAGLTSQKREYEIYPLIFFTVLFVNGSALQDYQYIRYEYMGYIAEYVYFHRRDIRDCFLRNEEIAVPDGFEMVYSEFGYLIGMCHQKYIVRLLCVAMSLALFFGGMLIGLNAGHQSTPDTVRTSVSQQSRTVSDSSVSDKNSSKPSNKNSQESSDESSSESPDENRSESPDENESAPVSE